MRTHLIALAATLGVAALVAAPMAGATAPSGGGSSAGGGGSHGGGGGGGGAHGGGGYGGGHFGGGHYGGGHYGGGHFGGGHYGGGHFGTGGYRGGAYGGRGGYAAHASFMTHGGFVSHGASGYRIVGSEFAGIAHVDAAPRGGHGGRISLALGPRMGSAATAARLDRVGRQERVSSLGKRPGHHPWHHPGQPKRHHVHVMNEAHVYNNFARTPPPDFCDDTIVLYKGQLMRTGCLWPTKMKVSPAR